VDELLENARIGPIVDGALKCRSLACAFRAARIAKCRVGRRQPVSANVATGKLNRLYGFNARGANWKPGNREERSLAESAVAGK
jgi:hypothetical protein